MEDQLFWQILLQLFLIAANAIFACAEIAVISINDNKLAQMAAQGDKRALKLQKLTSQPSRFLATIQVAITLSGFMASAFAAENFSEHLVEVLLYLGIPLSYSALNVISVVIITLLLSYFTLVFGELVPKRLAMKKAQELALSMASMVLVISKVAAPIVYILTASTNVVLKALGVDPNVEDENVSEEEIRMMVDIGNEKGVIDSEEKRIIHNVFEFDDLPVAEFATRRKDIAFIWAEETPEEWEKTIRGSRHSLYPVCGDTSDNIIGVLNAKDYFRLEDKSKDNILKMAVKPAFFVLDTTCADILFKKMKQSRNRFAVVLDEYGGLFGIVTMSDILEQLVGEFDDFEPEDSQIEQIKENVWRLSGGVSLEELSGILNIALPIEEYDTFSGYIFGNYGSIPLDGAQFEVDTELFNVKVLEIKDHRIEKAILTLLVKQE